MITVGKKKFKLRRPKGKKIPSASSSSLTPPPPWIELPADVTGNILHRLGAIEILKTAQKVCTTWRRVCMDPSMWRVIDMGHSGVLDLCYDLEVMCCHAIDRSHGQVIDINVEYFGTNELLFYISGSCSDLKRLTLGHCCDILNEVLRVTVQNLPMLEELHLFFVHAYAEDIEIIGSSCPQLKAFTFNNPGSTSLNIGNDLYALAVAKSMPNLHHLCLLGDETTNEGLEAILDGCPHLESLDIRLCFGVDLRGTLGRRCSQQIKDLRRPLDSIHDYKWASEIMHDWYPVNDNSYCESDFSYLSGGYSYEEYDDYTDPFHPDYSSDLEMGIYDDCW